MTRHLEATSVAAFTDEFRQSLPLILDALDIADRDPSDKYATHEAYRLIHALKGAASMVGLAAFGYLLNVAEELIEGSIGGPALLTNEAVSVLRAAMPRFAPYMDAALEGRPVEPLALDLARALRLGGGAVDTVSLRELIEIETREVALLPAEPEPPQAPSVAPEWLETLPLPEMSVLSEAQALPEMQALPDAHVWPDAPALPELLPSPEAQVLPELLPSPEAQVLPEMRVLPEAQVLPELLPSPEAQVLPETRVLPETQVLPEMRVLPETRVLPERLMFPKGLASPPLMLPEALTLPEPEVLLEPEVLPEPPGIPEMLASPEAPASTALEFDVVMKDEVPPELAEVFGEEAREHLETIARLTSRLSTVPQDRESVQELRRAVHTLKGAAGVVGYKGASKLAHRMEDLLDRLYEGTAAVTPQEAHILASSSDALNDLIVGTADPDALRALVVRLFGEFDVLVGVAPVSASADAMAAWVARESAGLPQPEFGGPADSRPIPSSQSIPGAQPLPDGQAVSASQEMSGSQPIPSSQPIPVSQPVPVGQPIFERRRRIADRRGSGQVLRVPLRRLNELVRVVSELVINRSTFEQHHTALIEQVDELKLSTARLRRVTHRLESDYEVRALGGNMAMVGPGSGRQAGSAGGHGFDELEFDRYTEFHLLTRELTETASDIATIGARVASTIGDFDGDLTRLGRLTREVQDKTMEFRMVPLGTLTTQLERAVRATGEICGKLVDFAIEGEHVSLDKSLLEQMADPLLHLLRNAVDHGIEAREERLAAGKPERGQITVRAFHEGTDVLIEVQDDGAGLDLERIRRTAIARGLVSEADAAAMSADAVYGFIFEPGFSTAQRVSEVSGRGVGMDVVKSKVGRLSGRVYVTSQAGAGATISVRVPMTLAITRVLLVRSGGETFGLPLGAVVQIVRPHPVSISLVGAERVFTVDGRTYPLRDLAATLGLSRAAAAPAVQPVLIANLSRRRIALAVDEIVNSRDAVVKTLGTHLRKVPGIWGATLLGDGTVVLILNPADLAGTVDEPVVIRHTTRRAVATVEHAPYTVLIVDDSLSMRHVLSLAVKKAGWNSVPARDGLEALEIIHRGTQPPDIVLLDIEMPRMDGFEFLTTIRAQKANADLPIVMLTSRGGDKHRDKAKALGVTDYMVKPFQEETLVHNIDRLVKAARESDRRAAS